MGRGAVFVVVAWLAVSLVMGPLIGFALHRLGGSYRRMTADGPAASADGGPSLDLTDASPLAPGSFRRVGPHVATQPVRGARVEVAASSVSADASAPAGPARAAASPSRRAIEEVIEHGAFTVSFQPIVHLQDRVTAGSEALTRFIDGARPDARFDDAVEVGLGTQLEVATMRMALSHAEWLPVDGYLALNVTPQLLYERDELAALIDELHREVVIELCERYPVDNYDALLASFEQFGPHVKLAVDDVGSGYASLRHILKLRPSIVKIDQSSVRNVDTDRDARAMVAAVCSLAASIDAVVIAEGVETERQVSTLTDLGVQYGQGWLLGRPKPVVVTLVGGAAAP